MDKKTHADKRTPPPIPRFAVLAVAFLMFIFYVGANEGTSVFRYTAETIGKTDFITVRDVVDKLYYNMLDYDYGILQNKGTYINFSGYMANLLGQRVFNERVKLSNGHLALLGEELDVSTSIENLSRLSEEQARRGGQYIFALAPKQTSNREEMLPAGVHDYANQNADRLLEGLHARGVATIDMREWMEDVVLSIDSDFFYNTDHHWTTEAGFLAYMELIQYLHTNGHIEQPPSYLTDLNYYNVETYTDYWLGAQGKRTGIYYAGLDDYTLILPDFETDFHVTIPDANYDASGSFQKAALQMERLAINNYFIDSPYGMYVWGAYGVRQYRNESAPLSKRILLIGDSFSLLPFAYMTLCFQETIILDMRYASEFYNYYNNYNPDIVSNPRCFCQIWRM